MYIKQRHRSDRDGQKKDEFKYEFTNKQIFNYKYEGMYIKQSHRSDNWGGGPLPFFAPDP